MKLIMAMSADGYFAKDSDDDMSWTDHTDKLIFRLMTLSDGNVLLAGRTTYNLLPPLKGRVIRCLTTKPRADGELTLNQAREWFPNAWLIGGPIVAAAAVQQGYVDRFIFVRNEAILGSGYPAKPLIDLIPTTMRIHRIKFDYCQVLIYSHDYANGKPISRIIL